MDRVFLKKAKIKGIGFESLEIRSILLVIRSNEKEIRLIRKRIRSN